MKDHRITVSSRSATLYRDLARLRHNGFGIALEMKDFRKEKYMYRRPSQVSWSNYYHLCITEICRLGRYRVLRARNGSRSRVKEGVALLSHDVKVGHQCCGQRGLFRAVC